MCHTLPPPVEAAAHTKTSDSAESVGDQFEPAYLYLWITDQPRALAIMLVCS